MRHYYNTNKIDFMIRQQNPLHCTAKSRRGKAVLRLRRKEAGGDFARGIQPIFVNENENRKYTHRIIIPCKSTWGNLACKVRFSANIPLCVMVERVFSPLC